MIFTPDYPKEIVSLTFRLYPSHIILIADTVFELSIRMYHLPSFLSSASPGPVRTSDDPIGPSAAEAFLPLKGRYDHQVSEPACHCHEGNNKPVFLSIVSFLSQRQEVSGPARLHRLEVVLSEQAPSICVLQAADEASISNEVRVLGDMTSVEAAVGSRGYRAIWSETSWLDRDEVRLMKMSLRESAEGSLSAPHRRELSTSSLIPSNNAVPFPSSACRSMALDEISGRVCLALFTGQIYILDF
jgi:hypothetical protein